MTKSPQGVYVNEATHNRVSKLVENALDGAGSLSGFVAFFEEKLFSMAREYLRAPERFGVGGEEFKQWMAAPKDGFQYEANRSDYEDSWNRLQAQLPWAQDDPSADLLAFTVLRQDARLWHFDGAYDAPRVHTRWDVDVAGVLDDIVRIGQGREPRVHSIGPLDISTGKGGATFIWKGPSVEVVLDGPKSASTSFYLEDEPHQFALRVFGRALFDRLERGLERLLNTHMNWLPWEAEFNFLEHGPELVGYQEPPTYIGFFDAIFGEVRMAKELYGVEDSLDPRVQGQVFPFSWNPAHVDPLGIIFPDVIAVENNSLIVAYRLGLGSDGDDFPGADVKHRLLAAFMERYGLQSLGPDRRLAYEVIRSSPQAPRPRGYISNALDLHLFRLFQAYAQSVLPLDQQDATRVELTTLATLSQPWVFPTQATLEAYGNAKVSKTASGSWEIGGGRTGSLVITDAEAYWSAKALNAVISTQPSQTMAPPLETNWIDENDNEWPWLVRGPAIAEEWLETVRETTSKRRFKIKLGLDVIRRARGDVVDGPRVLLAGAKLVADLTDEALEARGRFSQRFSYHMESLLEDVMPS